MNESDLLTSRQEKILKLIVEKYIRQAQPVSSLQISGEYDFGICPATIRNEMTHLTKKEYLSQPHTSSGKVPTDRGYDFFVNGILGNDIQICQPWFAQLKQLEDEFEDINTLVQKSIKKLAAVSDSLMMGYSPDYDFLYEDGWKELMLQPEFRSDEILKNFLKNLGEIEEKIEKFISDEKPKSKDSTKEKNKKNNRMIKIFIGKNNPFFKSDDFSLIISKINLPKTKKGGILAIFGPKRMSYKKNIFLMNTASKFFNEL